MQSHSVLTQNGDNCGDMAKLALSETLSPRGAVKSGDIIDKADEIEATDNTGEEGDKFHEKELLDKISPYFEIKTTSYGGRGCFALGPIKKGTSVLRVNRPIGSAVTRVFRKEVCGWCFTYMDGKTLKHRVQQKIYFCSEQCHNEFRNYDPQSILIDTLIRMEDLYVKCQGDIDEEGVPENEKELLRVMDAKWAEVDAWEARISKMKPTKRFSALPRVTVDDYAEIRYVITMLYSHYRQEKAAFVPKKFISEMDDNEALTFEKKLLEILYSSEIDKMKRYPYLLIAYINIYKFVRLVVPDEFLPYVNPHSVRNIIGKNLSNAFGVWSPTTKEDEGREYFGFGVYPSGSFFNHSCGYNVTRIRSGASNEYITTEDIESGTELCICYGILPEDSVDVRRKALSEWFFTCGCKRCVEESGGVCSSPSEA